MIEKNSIRMAARYIKQLQNRKQPIRNVLNTLLRLWIINKKKKSKFIFINNINVIGNKNHVIYIQHTKIRQPLMKYNTSKDTINNANFINNLIPSVIGLSKPNKKILGPIRSWNNAKNFRSNKE